MDRVPVDYRSIARRELINVYRDLEVARPGYGELFLQDVEKAIDLIFYFPQGFPLVTATVRKCRLPKFKRYSLYYAMEPQRLVIFAVFDGGRDPQDLEGRF